MTTEKIKDLITLMEFQTEDEKETVWFKKYPRHDEYVIMLDFEKLSIDYGKKIERGDETTSNFSSDENFVVLECVNRLLEKGYKPNDLTLERRWKLGRTMKSGKADINVAGRNGKTLMIIECKTWGKEYEKEKEKMIENGGQLFSYYQQDKSTKFLTIYASRSKDAIEYNTAIVAVEDTPEEIGKQTETDSTITYQKSSTVNDSLLVWQHKNKKQFASKGIFEEEIEPYNPGFVPLRIRDLKEFTRENARIEYDEFEEILRHNNISDRSNAFNRFISLVLAKIVDEEKPEDVIADFQNKKGIDTAEELIERLQSLYSKAMKDYLGETVINYTLDDIDNIISHFPRQTSKERLREIYKELKFYTNNEFSFKEVYNKELFEQNAKVLYEVVNRLQHFKFKYNAKAQFLGDFFEDMLESGFKQSEGQFFTPTPIAKFMVSSIPLKEIIERNISNKEAKILPSVIDYACGSGHFITEAIEEVQTIIKGLDTKHHKEISNYQNSTKWAGDYICGIEKDYRLARTSQVACFMHGDGDANIIFGDGLEEHPGVPVKEFDVLVANPPYSIEDFKKHLNHDRIAKFELLSHINPDSKNIEVLFVERTKQLLKEGGYAGVFLPTSILANTGIYTKAREILLKYFEIKGIVEFGNNTFSATGTNTVVLFMQRRSEEFCQNCLYIAEDFILGKDVERKNDFVDTQKLLVNYTTLINIPITDYKTLINRTPSKELGETDFYQSYHKWFSDLTSVKKWKLGKTYDKLTPEQKEKQFNDWFLDEVLEVEKEKFLYFLLSHRLVETPVKGSKKTLKELVYQQTVIVKSGKDSETQKSFLGYTFSDRRGFKGLDMKEDATGKEVTKLYDKDNLRSLEKANTYIWKSFNNEKIEEIDENVKEHINVINLVDCFDFERIIFEKQVSTTANRKSKILFDTQYPLVKFSTVASLEYGNSLPEEKRVKGEYPVMGSNGVVGYHKEYIVEGPAIIIGRKGSAGKITWMEKNCFPIDTTFYVKPDKTKAQLKYLHSILQTLNLEELGGGAGVPGLNRNDVYDIKIPLPGDDIQTAIVKEIRVLEKQEQAAIDTVNKVTSDIKNEIQKIYNKNPNRVRIEIICSTNAETIDPIKKYGNELFTYIDIDSVGKGTGLISLDKKIKGVNAASRAKRVAKDDTLIISTVRPYLKGFAYLKKVPKDSVISTGFAVINSLDSTVYLTEFLYYLFMFSDDLMGQMEAKMPKASYPSINEGDIQGFTVPSIAVDAQKVLLKKFGKLEVEKKKCEEKIKKSYSKKEQILRQKLK